MKLSHPWARILFKHVVVLEARFEAAVSLPTVSQHQPLPVGDQVRDFAENYSRSAVKHHSDTASGQASVCGEQQSADEHFETPGPTPLNFMQHVGSDDNRCEPSMPICHSCLAQLSKSKRQNHSFPPVIHLEFVPRRKFIETEHDTPRLIWGGRPFLQSLGVQSLQGSVGIEDEGHEFTWVRELPNEVIPACHARRVLDVPNR